MSSFGKASVGEILNDRNLRLAIAQMLVITEQDVLEGIAGHDEDETIDSLTVPIPSDLVNMSVSDARRDDDVITRLSLHTGLSEGDVFLQLKNTHGRTLLPKVFTFIWLDRPQEKISETKVKAQRRSSPRPATTSVFISYAHSDRKLVDAFKIHLRPLERDSTLEFWDDSKIKAGSNWRTEIADAIDRATAAILFISASFLASDFIHSNEIPPLLARARDKGTRILPLIVGHSLFTNHPVLSTFQAVNDPSTPLGALGKHQRDKLYVKVAKELETLLAQRRRS